MSAWEGKILRDPLSAFFITQSVGSLVGGIQQNRNARQEAEAAEQNARQVEAAADKNEELRRRQVRKILGSQFTQAAASGFTPSDFAIIKETAIESDLQGQINLFNAGIQATKLRNLAVAERAQGEAALVQGFFNAASTAFEGRQKFLDIRKQKEAGE